MTRYILFLGYMFFLILLLSAQKQLPKEKSCGICFPKEVREKVHCRFLQDICTVDYIKPHMLKMHNFKFIRKCKGKSCDGFYLYGGLVVEGGSQTNFIPVWVINGDILNCYYNMKDNQELITKFINLYPNLSTEEIKFMEYCAKETYYRPYAGEFYK